MRVPPKGDPHGLVAHEGPPWGTLMGHYVLAIKPSLDPVSASGMQPFFFHIDQLREVEFGHVGVPLASLFPIFSLPGAFIDHSRALLLLNYGISRPHERKGRQWDYRNSVLRGEGRARLGLDYDDYGEVRPTLGLGPRRLRKRSSWKLEKKTTKLQSIFTTVQNPRLLFVYTTRIYY